MSEKQKEIIKAVRADLRLAAAALRRVQTRLAMAREPIGPPNLRSRVSMTQGAIRALMEMAK